MQAPLKLPAAKTKIVCTIGPSSSSLSTLESMIESGMNVARLNFSHGGYKDHARNIHNIRGMASKARRMVSILIDVPGAKIRIGRLKDEPLILKKDSRVVLTSRAVPGTQAIIPVEFKALSKSVKKGGTVFINDGFMQLKVEKISGEDVY